MQLGKEMKEATLRKGFGLISPEEMYFNLNEEKMRIFERIFTSAIDFISFNLAEVKYNSEAELLFIIFSADTNFHNIVEELPEEFLGICGTRRQMILDKEMHQGHTKFPHVN